MNSHCFSKIVNDRTKQRSGVYGAEEYHGRGSLDVCHYTVRSGLEDVCPHSASLLEYKWAAGRVGSEC
jgi:hypothetical protein